MRFLVLGYFQVRLELFACEPPGDELIAYFHFAIWCDLPITWYGHADTGAFVLFVLQEKPIEANHVSTCSAHKYSSKLAPFFFSITLSFATTLSVDTL